MERVRQKQLDILRRNLRRLRTTAGLTQEGLAEKAGIAPRYLQMLEAGNFGCSLAVLIGSAGLSMSVGMCCSKISSDVWALTHTA